MSRHLQHGRNRALGGLLGLALATVSHGAFASEVRLISPDAAAQMAAPAEYGTLREGSTPLQVVIPNINKEKKSTKHAKKSSSRSSGQNASAPAANDGPSQGVVANIYNSVQEAWNNGVLHPDWNSNPLIRTILKPNIAFLPIPEQWRVYVQNTQYANAQDTQTIASLAPAAGQVTTVPAQPIVPAIGNQVRLDATEPAPSLSSQSKAVLNKFPAMTDKAPEKPLRRKVDIAHARETSAGVLSQGAQPNEGLGIQSNVKRGKMDVNYELERAYNALIAGKSDIAIQIYEDILTGDPRNKDALFGLASTYHRAGQIDLARSLYAKLLKVDPKHRDGLNNFLVLLSEEAPQEALSHMAQLETQNPDFSPIPAQMAIIYQKLGERDKAIEKMYRALAISPENVTYRYNLAIMLDKAGKYPEASQLYTQILAAHAKGATIPGDAGKIQQRLTFIRSNTPRS